MESDKIPKCPKCGSSSKVSKTESNWYCSSCGLEFSTDEAPMQNGAQFDTATLDSEDMIDIHEIFNDAEGENNSTGDYITGDKQVYVNAEYSKEDFIRKFWITLAKEGAPIDVFDVTDYNLVKRVRVYIEDTVNMSVSYEATAGYDRQETYETEETYQESEPYVEYEKVYNNDLKRIVTNQVTKYKIVDKTRQVTKTRTVTDWRPYSLCKDYTRCAALVENIEDTKADTSSLYSAELKVMSSLPVVISDMSKFKSICLYSGVSKLIEDKQAENAKKAISADLPQGKYKDSSCSYEVSHRETTVSFVPEYEATINYKGKSYSKRAFPFGHMEMTGTCIEDNSAWDEDIKQAEKDLYNYKSYMNDSYEIKTLTIPRLNICLTAILMSIDLTLLIIFAAMYEGDAFEGLFWPIGLMIACLCIGIVLFAYVLVFCKVYIAKARKITDKHIYEETEKVNREIAAIQAEHRKKIRMALDSKLCHMGMLPVTDAELEGWWSAS